MLTVTFLIAGYTATRIDGVFRHPVIATRLLVAEPPRHLPVPVIGLRSTQLRDSWGAPRSGGRNHKGIDIFAPRGRAIVSTTPGILATIGTNRLGGKVVRVFGPGGHWHYYAHLEKFASIREGDVIAAGTIVGYVGDSGNAKGTPPHLHYGIYRFQGGAINPYPLLAPRARRTPAPSRAPERQKQTRRA